MFVCMLFGSSPAGAIHVCVHVVRNRMLFASCFHCAICQGEQLSSICQYMQDELGVCLCVPMQVNIRRPFSNLEMCSTLVVLMGHVARVHGKASCRTTPAGQQAPNRISRQGADAMHNFVKSGCQVCMLLI